MREREREGDCLFPFKMTIQQSKHALKAFLAPKLSNLNMWQNDNDIQVAWICGRGKERVHTQGRPHGERSSRADVHTKSLAGYLVAQLMVATFSIWWKAPHLILCDAVQFKTTFALPLYP